MNRRIFLGWAGFTSYGAAALLRPPHARAGPKVKAFAGAATAAGAALNATVVVSSNDLYDDAYEDSY